MFDELKTTVDGLLTADADFTKYNNAKEARKTLQKIHVMTKKLRADVTAAFKASKVK